MNEIIVIRLAIHSIFESVWAKNSSNTNETLENMPMAREKKNAISLKQNEREKNAESKLKINFNVKNLFIQLTFR